MSQRTDHFQAKALELEKEFEAFSSFCKKQNLTKSELDLVYAPIKRELKIQFWVKFLKIVAVLTCLSLAVYYISVVNWNLSAIGRIAMIKMLPIWNWRSHFNNKCLVPYFNVGLGSYKNEKVIKENYKEDCVVCETLDHIDTTIDITHTTLIEKYLFRGLPVIISDSVNPWNPFDFIENLLQSEKLLKSQPCELQSNLLLGKYSNLEESLKLSIKESEVNESVFLHFQNCELDAVKATRFLIAHRPKFFPPHLEPAESSWILISKNYKSNDKRLYLKGLILVMQLTGKLELVLVPSRDCLESCDEHVITLMSGESLVFTTDLWNLVYYPSDGEISVTVITETYWNP